LFEPYVDPGMPDEIKKYGSLLDVAVLSSEVYTVTVIFGSPPFFLEAALYGLLDLRTGCYP